MSDRNQLEAFDDAAGDVATTIYGHYCNLGLTAVEREVFMSEVHQRLADILQYRDGSKGKARSELESRVATEEDYSTWSDNAILKSQPDYDPETKTLDTPRDIGGKVMSSVQESSSGNPINKDRIPLQDGIYDGLLYEDTLEIQGHTYATRYTVRCDRRHCGGYKQYEIRNGYAYSYTPKSRAQQYIDDMKKGKIR